MRKCFIYLFNNYSFVPATRTWPTLWHKRDEGWYALYPFDKLFDEQYFKNSFFDDLENENPKYAVLGTDIKNTYNNSPWHASFTYPILYILVAYILGGIIAAVSASNNFEHTFFFYISLILIL